MSGDVYDSFKMMVPESTMEDLRKEAGLENGIDWSERRAQEFWDRRLAHGL
jgi:hypothetical protein